MNVSSALFLIARIHSTTNFKIYEQTKKSLNPTNTQSSSEESLKEKRLCHDIEAYSQPSQICNMERFAIMVNG